MPSTDYGGESPAKTLVRKDFWRAENNCSLYNKDNVLVLAGHDAGDVHQLYAMGRQNVYAVDHKAKALTKAEAKFTRYHPNHKATFIHGDITKINFPVYFRTIFLDWCGVISEKRLDMSFSVAENNLASRAARTPGGGALGLGFTKSRDGLAGGENTHQRRIQFILDYIKRNHLPYKLSESWTYQSKREDSGGVPMLYLLFTHCKRTTHNLAALYTPIHWSATKQDVMMAAKYALSIGTKLQDVADTFMLSPGTVAALKAHVTMQQGPGYTFHQTIQGHTFTNEYCLK